MFIDTGLHTRSAAEVVGLEALTPIGVRMAFAAGEEIYGQEDDAEFVYRVLSGAVRTSRVTADGRRQVGDFYYAEEMFGLETSPQHTYSAEALSRCEVLVVRRSALRLYGEQGLQFERLIWAATAKELARTQAHLMMLGRRSACEKVATFLLDLADRTRANLVELPMGRQDIADFLGLTIETVSRMLTQLQSEGVIRFEALRRFRIQQRATLAQMAEA